MIRINIEQGSPEWKAMRRLHITATDAACILGLSPFKTAEELYYEKMDGIETPVNNAMRRGNELEPIARQLLNEATGIEFTPTVGVHDTEGWCMASLDGISPCGRYICEIKCPSTVDTHNLVLQGTIKEYYRPQVQHALFVSGSHFCFFCSYFPGHEYEIVKTRIYPNEEFIPDMIEKERVFYKEHLCKMNPPKEWKLSTK